MSLESDDSLNVWVGLSCFGMFSTCLPAQMCHPQAFHLLLGRPCSADGVWNFQTDIFVHILGVTFS